MRLVTTFNRLPKIRANLHAKLPAVVEKTARDVQARATSKTHRVDTGAMQGGWKVRVIGPRSAAVYNTQEYAIYHEFGTVKMSAAPMLRPAAEEAFPAFAEAVRQLLEGEA